MKRLEEDRRARLEESKKLDLSDEGLLADLKKREGLDPDKLVLYEDSEHWGYHHDGHHRESHDKHHEKHGGKEREKHAGKDHAPKA